MDSDDILCKSAPDCHSGPIVGKKWDHRILDPLFFSGKIREDIKTKNTPQFGHCPNLIREIMRV